MNENYDFKNIERNCQSDWQKNDLFSSKKDLNKKNIMFSLCFHTQVVNYIWDMFEIIRLEMLYLALKD
jgi:leucyl-tRNA synthetase